MADGQPGARDSTAEGRSSDRANENSCLALVMLDGADTAMLSRVDFNDATGALAPNTSLQARFCSEPRGAMTDFWFEPVVEVA